MSRPTLRARRFATWAAIPAALALSGAVVAHSSYSAFSATTSNPTSNWAAGSVGLTDDDSNTAAFTVSNLAPGSTGSRCIVVTSTGSLPSTVKVYTSNAATTNALSSYINMTITTGSGGSFGSCTNFTPLSSGSTLYSGTLANLGSSNTNYSTGLGNWVTAGGTESRTYKLTYTVDPAVPNSAQGGTAAIGFTWEAQNN